MISNKSQKHADVMAEPSGQTAEGKYRFLAAIVQSTEDAVIGETLEGVITSWNQAAEKMFGYAEQEVVGKSISILSSPATRPPQ